MTSSNQEKTPTLITPDLLVNYCRKQLGLSLTPVMAQGFIDEYRDHFAGKTLDVKEVRTLLIEHFGMKLPRQYAINMRVSS